MEHSQNSTEGPFIQIRGARLHNLKQINLDIPRDHFVVVTGLSGSGKSTLAFDTLYAEGQRRYVESLSSYARQFLKKIDKPKVDSIKGISPSIAIEQKPLPSNPRSTVGINTEIYDYLKLLYARIGKTYSPVSQEEVKKNDTQDVVRYLRSLPDNEALFLMSPLVVPPYRTFIEQMVVFRQQGYVRTQVDGHLLSIEEVIDYNYEPKNPELSFLVIERITTQNEEAFYQRLAESIEIAFKEGQGRCLLEHIHTKKRAYFSERFEKDGIVFNLPSIHLFSFNNSYGACPVCEGYGKIIGIDKDLVIPDKTRSVYEDAVACWRGASLQIWKQKLISNAQKSNFPIHKPYRELSDLQEKMLWEGSDHFEGIHAFFKKLEEKNYKVQNRVLIARYRGKTICRECQGNRLRKEAQWVKVNQRSITELVTWPLDELLCFFKQIKLSDGEKPIAKRILSELMSRTHFLEKIGLGYLTLDRSSSTLSGGEYQRIHLATSLGSNLVGATYVLDEPSVGLHPKNTLKLIELLKELRALGNTVIVVEHDEEIIRAADYLIDIGPRAGAKGGELVFSGFPNQLEKAKNSLTADYLLGTKKIEPFEKTRSFTQFIELKGACENNLKDIDVKFPLHMLTFIAGASGSGKSTLVKEVLYPALVNKLSSPQNTPNEHAKIEGDVHLIAQIELVDQNLVGKSSRSNPATYTKAFDEIRNVFMLQRESKQMGYTKRQFSFNTEGGRCEKCKGEGTLTIEMQFMADVILECEECGGKRFNKETLKVQVRGKNIADVLEMTVDEAFDFFNEPSEKKIRTKIQTLQQVGLGYLKLGQSSSTLSGGEAQRMKLALFLSKSHGEKPTLFILDEPSRGLHFHDVKTLLNILNALVEKGNSLLVIEHNIDMIANADWVIELGPGGGKKGGCIIAEGTPKTLCSTESSEIGRFLRQKLHF